MNVMSLRLEEKEMKLIEEMVRKEGKDKSTITRELIGYGLTYLMIRLYREGRLSLEKVAKELDLSAVWKWSSNDESDKGGNFRYPEV